MLLKSAFKKVPHLQSIYESLSAKLGVIVRKTGFGLAQYSEILARIVPQTP